MVKEQIIKISDELSLPCGAVLPNRIAKSAMSENMANANHYPGPEFFNAYKTWADGGTGLSISGNVMIDSRYRGEPHNVVIEKGLDNHKELGTWARASNGTRNNIWLQLNHPGKQTPKFLTRVPVAPSAVSLKPPLNKAFNDPRELKEEEILDIIERFSYAALVAKEAGFAGVQIHGAHGYLVSQFLSPHHNRRTDKWGGSISERALFVKEVYRSMRKAVGESFPIGIKINSADFSKGGFSNEEAVYVCKMLSDLGIDLIELSGGSYEKAVMTGVPIKESTEKREAYFLEYAKKVKEVVDCPLMVTGGFRTSDFMRKVIENGEVDLVGLGRSLCIDPNFSKKILGGENHVSPVKPLSSGSKLVDAFFPLEIIWYTNQIHRMGANKMPNPDANVYSTIFKVAAETGLQMFKKVRGNV